MSICFNCIPHGNAEFERIKYTKLLRYLRELEEKMCREQNYEHNNHQKNEETRKQPEKQFIS